jgi:hypothetical protein
MRLFQANHEGYGFEFTRREKELLFEVISLYPLIPAAHHRLSRTPGPRDEENQKLLDESLASHREETRQRVRTLLNNPRTFQKQGAGYHWLASRGEMEWLLQVLNDIRVGSWLALGCPRLPPAQELPSTPESLAHRRAMDIAGGFEMIFIAALDGDLPASAA